MNDPFPSISLIGSGNVATALALALSEAGVSVRCVFSRSRENAETLAGRLHAEAVCRLQQVPKTDICIYCVKDDVLPAIAGELGRLQPQALHIHTSGCSSLSVFPREVEKRAVLYPLQTFSKAAPPDFSHIPCFVEAGSAEALLKVTWLARRVSQDVRELTHAARQHLHLAAVFACNFTNHCYAVAESIAKEAGVSFSTLLPLIDETAAKVHRLPPREAQTGPAVRDDRRIMDAHLALLPDDGHRRIYEVMSGDIHFTNNEVSTKSIEK